MKSLSPCSTRRSRPRPPVRRCAPVSPCAWCCLRWSRPARRAAPTGRSNSDAAANSMARRAPAPAPRRGDAPGRTAYRSEARTCAHRPRQAPRCCSERRSGRPRGDPRRPECRRMADDLIEESAPSIPVTTNLRMMNEIAPRASASSILPSARRRAEEELLSTLSRQNLRHRVERWDLPMADNAASGS